MPFQKPMLLPGAACAAICLGATMTMGAMPARAQQKPLEPAAATAREADGAETREVRVRNMDARVMAFLLDRQQPEPLLFSTSRANALDLDSPAPALSELFHVPALLPGVSIVEVKEAQNVLSLRGAAGDLDAWQAAIEVLDKPLDQIQVEVQMVKLGSAALKYLGAPANTPGPHLLAGDVGTRLRALVATNEAKVVMAPRVTAVSGLTASLSSVTATPLTALEGTTPLTMFFLLQRIGMAVRPTLRAGDTIDMQMAVGASWLAQIGDDAAAPLRRAQPLSFRAADGDTYLFYARPNFVPPAPTAPPASRPGDASPAAVRLLAAAQPDAEGRIAVFIVCTRIIRRINDATVQAAP